MNRISNSGNPWARPALSSAVIVDLKLSKAMLAVQSSIKLATQVQIMVRILLCFELAVKDRAINSIKGTFKIKGYQHHYSSPDPCLVDSIRQH